MNSKTLVVARLFSGLIALLSATFPLIAAEGSTNPPTAPAAVAAPGQPDAQAAAPGARRGGRGRGGPMTADDQAAIAKLSELPAWKPGVGVGDFTAIPPHAAAPENTPRDNVPKGKVVTFTIPLVGSQFYPPSGGRGRGGPGVDAAPGAANPAEREVNVYIPAQYVPGTPAPLLFCHDAMGMHDNKPAPYLPDILDNMIADKRLPVMIAVMVMPGSQGQRSLEYD